jgi:hypothetical protein
MGTWSITGQGGTDLVSIDSSTGELTYEEHTEDTVYTITYEDDTCGTITKEITIKACAPGPTPPQDLGGFTIQTINGWYMNSVKASVTITGKINGEEIQIYRTTNEVEQRIDDNNPDRPDGLYTIVTYITTFSSGCWPDNQASEACVGYTASTVEYNDIRTDKVERTKLRYFREARSGEEPIGISSDGSKYFVMAKESEMYINWYWTSHCIRNDYAAREGGPGNIRECHTPNINDMPLIAPYQGWEKIGDIYYSTIPVSELRTKTHTVIMQGTDKDTC